MINFSVKFIAYCNTILEDKVGVRCGRSVSVHGYTVTSVAVSDAFPMRSKRVMPLLDAAHAKHLFTRSCFDTIRILKS